MTHTDSLLVTLAATAAILLVAGMAVVAGLHHAATPLTFAAILGCLVLFAWALLPPPGPDQPSPAWRAVVALAAIDIIAAFDALTWARLAHRLSPTGEDRGRVVLLGLIMIAFGNYYGKFRAPPGDSLAPSLASEDRIRRRQGLWLMACGFVAIVAALALGFTDRGMVYSSAFIGWAAIKYTSLKRAWTQAPHRRP